MKWFKHESDARNSVKLRKVRRKYGADGYAIYWFCVEAIAYEVDKDNLTFDLKEDAETIGFELVVQEKRVEEIMKFMIEIGLFESSQGLITCLKLAERLDKSMTNSPSMRKWLGNKNVMTSADSVLTPADQSLTSAELEVDKEKELEKEKINNKKNKQKKTVSAALDYSCWNGVVSEQVLTDWLAMRKQRRANVTQTVINRLAKQINLAVESGMTVDEVLSECCARGWQGFEYSWVNKSNGKSDPFEASAKTPWHKGDLGW